MFLTNVKRIARTGLMSFWRNGFVSLASVLIMIITLSVIGAMAFLNVMLETSLTAIKDKVDVNVYFVTDATEESVLAIRDAIQELPEVAHVEYTSREQALENFRTRHQNDELTLRALEELDTNPLGAVLNIKAKEPSQYEGIASYLESDAVLSPNGASVIDKVNYFQNKTAIDKLNTIIESADKLGFAIMITLVVISILITLNTIRLAIYISREEIAVMKLVGASNMYVRGPFIIVGMLYGAIAGMLTLIVFLPITYWLGDATESFFIGINLFNYYLSHFGQIFLLIMVSGILIGAVSSFLAIKKYVNRV